MHRTRSRHRHRRHSATHGKSLSTIPAGETVTIAQIHGGHRLRRRLADLGMNAGMSVRVVQNTHVGPLILAVQDDTRLALGRGMAKRIQVAL